MNSPPFLRSLLVRYGLAVGAVAIGFGLYLGLSAWVGSDLPTFITFYPAVMVAALVGGLRPGLFATALAALVVEYWIQQPRGLFTVNSLHDGVALGLFCLMGAFLSTVVHLYQRARRKAAAYDQELALRETRREKEFLANLLEHAEQPFAVGYPDGRIGRLNRAYEQLTGYTAAELRALDWSATLTPPEWRGLEKQKLDELDRTGQPVRYEKEYVRKDGSHVPIELLVHVARDAEGKPEYYYAFLTDITEHRRAEQAARESAEHLGQLNAELQAANAYLVESRTAAVKLMEDALATRRRADETNQRLQALMQAVPVGISFSEDSTCQCITGNPAVLAQFEVSPEDNLSASAPDATAAGRQVRFFHAGRPITDVDLPLQRAVAENKVIPPMELEVVMPSGRRWFADASGAPVRDAQGKVIGGIAVTVDITERKRIEETLRNNEATLRGILDATQESMWLFSPQGLMLNGNAIAFSRFGKPAEEIIGKHFTEILPPELARTRLARLREAVESARPVEFQDERSGIAFHHSYYPVLEAGGRVTSVACFSRDITARRQAEEQLHKLNAELEQRVAARTAELHAAYRYARSLIEASLDPLVTISPDGLVTDVNGATELVTGLPRERLIGSNFCDYFTEPSRAEAGYQNVLADGLVREYPLTIRHVSGRTTDVLYNASVYRNEGGQVQGVFAAARDVTARKRMEEQLRATNESLQQLAAIVEFSDDAIIGKTLDGVITSWNMGAERIYGYTAGEVLGKPIGLLTAPGRPNEVPQILERTRHGDPVEHYETVRIRKDGQCITVSLTVSPIKDAAGRIVGASTIARDITERKRMEEQLRSASLYARSLIEASLDPLVTINALGKITDVNRATELATGVPRTELIGSDFSRYFTEPHKADEGYRQVIAEGFVRDYPLTLRHVSGRTIDVLYNASVYRNEAGAVQGVFAAARDMTVRKRMEEELRTASLYARSLIEASLDPLVTISETGIVTDVNQATELVTGVARSQLIGSNFCDYFTEPSRAEAGYQNVLADGLVREYPLTIRHVSGRTTDVLYNATVFRNEAGAVQGVFAAARDVTERKRVEGELARYRDHLEELVNLRTAELESANARLLEEVEERKRAEQALRESEAQLKRAQEIAHLGSWELDTVNNRLSWSDEVYRIFGLHPQEFDATYAGFIAAVHPEDRAAVDAAYSSSLREGRDSYEIEHRILRASTGEVRIVHEKSQHLRDADGRIIRSIGMVHDITERKRAEEQLRLLSVAVESAGNGIAVTNRQGTVLWVNPAFAELTGYSQSEAVGQNPRVLKSGRQSHDFYRSMWQTILAGHVWRGELVNRRKDGSLYSEEMTLTPVRASGAEITHFIAIKQDITARKRVEEALRASEARFRSVFDHAATGIAITDCAGRFVQCNAAYCELTGYSQAELAAMEFSTLILPEDRDHCLGFIRQLLGGERPSFEIENRYLHKNGSHVWVHKHVSTLRDARGEPTHIVALVTDMAERKQIEETLRFLVQCGARHSGEGFFQELARYLAQALGMDFVCIDRLEPGLLAAQTLAVFHNGQFEDNVSYALKDTPCGDVVGKRICCFPRDVRRLFPKDSVLQDLQAESYLGTTLWSSQGQPIGLIAVIGHQPLANTRRAESILQLVAVRAAGELERTQAEAALRRAHDELELRVQARTAELQQTNEQLRREAEVRRQTEQELTKAELRYRTVADFTYDWEYWETPEFRLEHCSPSCERITGYSAQEFMFDPRLVQQIVHPDDAGIWQSHREESLAAPEPRVIQFRIRRKDGNVRWLEHAWQPVLGKDGVFLGIRASNRDVTDRKEEELQTQQLREELAHVTRATTAGQLAASLAHELNQPLTAIRCNAETGQQFLTTDPPNLAEVREVLDDIAHDSERAGGVIQRLRALFNKTGHERSVLQLNDVIQETLDLLRSEFVLKGITTQIHLEPTLPEVRGNRIELQQVVLNLVVNAMEAMSERDSGQRQLQIATGCEGPREIRASVRDSGPGIRVEPVNRLFEPFFTTKASGMGMGLAISQSIIEAHGGSLGAVNNMDQGATFHLTLPIHHREHA